MAAVQEGPKIHGVTSHSKRRDLNPPLKTGEKIIVATTKDTAWKRAGFVLARTKRQSSLQEAYQRRGRGPLGICEISTLTKYLLPPRGKPKGKRVCITLLYSLYCRRGI